MSYKNEILKNTGMNEAVNFDQGDILKLRSKFDEIGGRIADLREELNQLYKESNEFRTDKGDFLLKGHNDYVRAFQALDKAVMNIRKGSFKGLGKMPSGDPGTFYDDDRR